MKRNFFIICMLTMVMLFSMIAYAGSQQKVEGRFMGSHETDSVTCTKLVILSITTSSDYASGIMRCKYDGSWKDIPGSTITQNNTSVQYTLTELNDLLFTSASSYECLGRLRITCPMTIYTNYLTITAS